MALNLDTAEMSSRDLIEDNPEIAMAWMDLMRLQVELISPHEIPFFMTSNAWKKSSTVADLGTGVGLHLYELARFFPQKNFVGIDVSQGYITQAKQNLPIACSNVEFKVSNVFNVTDQYDAAVCRLLIQHLPSIEKFMKNMEKVIKKGGHLFILESRDDLRMFSPDLPVVDRFFAMLRENRQEAGMDRDSGIRLLDMASQFNFECIDSRVIIAPSTTLGAKELFKDTYSAAFRVGINDFGLRLDIEESICELTEWMDANDSYTHLCIDIKVYQKL